MRRPPPTAGRPAAHAGRVRRAAPQGQPVPAGRFSCCCSWDSAWRAGSAATWCSAGPSCRSATKSCARSRRSTPRRVSRSTPRPTGEFLTAEKLFDRYNAMNGPELRAAQPRTGTRLPAQLSPRRRRAGALRHGTVHDHGFVRVAPGGFRALGRGGAGGFDGFPEAADRAPLHRPTPRTRRSSSATCNRAWTSNCGAPSS